MVDPQGNQTNYNYNYDDKLRSREEPDPDGAGPLTTPKYEYFYDTMNRMTSEKDPFLKSEVYKYDARSGKVAQITDRSDPPNLTTFGYDGLKGYHWGQTLFSVYV